MQRRLDAKHRRYSKRDVAVMAVCHTGGAVRHVHLEDVAIKAAELSPKAFSWKKYPERVNLDSVRLALKGELALLSGRVVGGIRDGWMVTPEGLSWCLERLNAGAEVVITDGVRKEVARAKRTAAFKKAIGGSIEEVSGADVEALLRINEYFSARERKGRAVALANAGVLDSQLRRVLDSLRERGFNHLEVKR